MNSSKQIAARFREVHLNGKWVAQTNCKLILEDVTWEQAITKIGSLNTIAALTFHLNYYISGLLNVFNGGDLEIRDKFSFDLPPIQSEEEWKKLCEELFANSEEFANHVEKMSDEDLDADFVKKEYGTWRRNIESMIEHGYYHLGQISLLKKMVLEEEKSVKS